MCGVAWRGVENGEQYRLQRVDNKIVVCCMCNKRCACEQCFYGMTFTITLIQIPDNLISDICLYVSNLSQICVLPHSQTVRPNCLKVQTQMSHMNQHIFLKCSSLLNLPKLKQWVKITIHF